MEGKSGMMVGIVVGGGSGGARRTSVVASPSTSSNNININSNNSNIKSSHPIAYLCASGCSAVVNFPLWKASAIGQAGYKLNSPTFIGKYMEALRPPWRGALPVIAGLTWARGAIFYGSDIGKRYLTSLGFGPSVSTALPPLLVSTFVQCCNMPLIRCTIMMQNPEATHASVTSMARHLIQTRGWGALWHGLSAGIFKTVPKYVTAVCVKDWMDGIMQPADPTDRMAVLVRSAKKSVVAGLAGAVLTNPLDVIRNTMFKTDKSLMDTVRHLHSTSGWSFLHRGMTKNLVAVALPISITIFLTDAFVRLVS